MKRWIWRLSLIASVLLLSPAAFAQTEKPTPSEKVVLLKISKLDKRKSTAETSTIMPASAASSLKGTPNMVEARMRVSGKELIIELTAPLPEKSGTLRLTSNLALDSVGGEGCMVRKGTYGIDYSDARNGRIRLPVTDNPVLSIATHRKRRSRRDIG